MKLHCQWKWSKNAAPSMQGSGVQSRPIRLLAPLYDGLGAGLAFCAYIRCLPLAHERLHCI